MRHIKLNTKNNSLTNKKHSVKNLYLLSAAVLCAGSGFSIAEDMTECPACKCSDAAFYAEHYLLRLQPEVGVDLGFTKTRFKNGQGDKLLNRSGQLPFNVFFGFNFTERFGVELGYGETKNKHTSVTLVGPNDFAPGATKIPAGQYQTYNSSLSTTQPYLSLTYKYPVLEKLHLFGAVGVMRMKVHASWDNINDNGTPTPPQTKALRSKVVEISKTIPILKVGAYYHLNEAFALRFITTFSQTSKLQKFIPSSSIHGIATTLKSKNNIQYSFGLIYKI